MVFQVTIVLSDDSKRALEDDIFIFISCQHIRRFILSSVLLSILRFLCLRLR